MQCTTSLLLAVLAGRAVAQDRAWGWRVWNAATDATVQTWKVNEFPDRHDIAVEIDLDSDLYVGMTATDINIECRTKIGEVKTQLYLDEEPDGSPFAVETVQPFMLFADIASTGDILPGTFVTGNTYEVWCIPIDANERASNPHKITMSITGAEPAAGVVGMELWDASSNTKIADVIQGATIEVAVPPESLTVKAMTQGDVSKVRWKLSSVFIKEDNAEPFFLYGDDGGVPATSAGYTALGLGWNKVRARAFASGPLLDPLVISFTLSEAPEDTTPPDEAACESTPLEGGTFCGTDNLIVLEAEDFPLEEEDEGHWVRENSVPGALNGCYRNYVGPNDFVWAGRQAPTSVQFVPATTGQYTLQMRSFINMGTDTSEHNDVWVRILDADANSIIYLWVPETRVINNDNIVAQVYWPKGDFNVSAYLNPDGDSGDPPAFVTEANSTRRRPHGAPGRESFYLYPGWVKVYRHGPLGFWDWKTRVGDFQGFEVKVYLIEGETYTFEMSGRSVGHIVDRFVLHTSAIGTGKATAPEGNAAHTPYEKSPLCE